MLDITDGIYFLYFLFSTQVKQNMFATANKYQYIN